MNRRLYYVFLVLLTAFNVHVLSISYKRLKPIILAMCAGSLTGCGHFMAFQKTTYPEELKPFMVRYIDAKITHHNNGDFSKPILITFGELESPTAATCSNFGFKGRIIIDKETWDYSDFYTRLVLVFHELGHCDLNYMFHVPDTLMNSYLLHGVNDDNIDRYVKQLFDTDFMINNAVEEDCDLTH